MSQGKITKTIKKTTVFDEKYPYEQAELEKETMNVVKLPEETDKIMSKEMVDAFNETAQDGLKNDKKYMYELPVFDGKMRIKKEEPVLVNIDYETINKEKLRMISGRREVKTLQELVVMPEQEKLKLAGAKEPYLLFPGMNKSGNIPFIGPRAGRLHNVSSQIYANEKLQ
jgi:hypothetical protein